MILLKHNVPAMRTYEIPVSAGIGFASHTITTSRRTLVRPPDDQGHPADSLLMAKHPHTQQKRLPVSVTLTAKGTRGDTSEALPDVVQHLEPFKTLIARRAIVVLPAEEAPKEPPQEPARAAAPTITSGGTTKKGEAPVRRSPRGEQ